MPWTINRIVREHAQRASHPEYVAQRTAAGGGDEKPRCGAVKAPDPVSPSAALSVAQKAKPRHNSSPAFGCRERRVGPVQ
jgi:hypothetical protein